MASEHDRGSDSQAVTDSSNSISSYWANNTVADREFFTHEVLDEFEKISSSGWRAYIRDDRGGGFVDRVRLGEGVEVGLLNCVMPETDRQTYDIDEGLLLLYASLSSNISFSVEGHPTISLTAPGLALISVPSGNSLTVETRGGVRQQRMFGLFRHTEFGAAFKLDAIGEIPPMLAEAVAGRGKFGCLASLPLDEHTSQTLTNIMDSSLSGEMRAMQYLARLVELSAHVLQAMVDTRPQRTNELKTTREVELVKLAHSRLSADFRNPPDLAALAYELGTNPNKLRAAFKKAYGVTMAEYCRDRRMREAQRLLLEPDLTIAQVAEAVGYEYQSGFAAAFSAHLGMSPREYRKHRAGLTVNP